MPTGTVFDSAKNALGKIPYSIASKELPLRVTGGTLGKDKPYPMRSGSIASTRAGDPFAPITVENEQAWNNPDNTPQLLTHEMAHQVQNNWPQKIQDALPPVNPNDPYNFGGRIGLQKINMDPTRLSREQTAAVEQEYQAQRQNGNVDPVYKKFDENFSAIPLSVMEPTDPNQKGINMTPRPPGLPSRQVAGLEKLYAKDIAPVKPGSGGVTLDMSTYQPISPNSANVRTGTDQGANAKPHSIAEGVSHPGDMPTNDPTIDMGSYQPVVPAAPLPAGLQGPATGGPVTSGNYLQNAVDNAAAPDSASVRAKQTPLENGLSAFGKSFTRGIVQPLVHPLDTVMKPLSNFEHPENWAMPKTPDLIDSTVKDYRTNGPVVGTGDLLGTGAAILTAGGVAAGVLPKVIDAGSAMRTAAIGDPDIAALRGLRVPASSPKTLSTLKSVEGARPYLQGVDSLQDLQTRIPQAKAEIWQPYQEAIDAIGKNPVTGPDGVTTVGDLENERLQVSALLRGLKSRSPEAIQLAQQKGLTQAQLLTREQQIKSALDPHLERAGVNPREIRARFGNVAQIGGKISGKSTLAETPQPYGFGKMMDLQIDHPRSWLGSPVQGVRDLVAGRPLWQGLPTDVNLREAFRLAGPKPSLGNYSPFEPKGLLGGPQEASEIPYEFGTPTPKAMVTPSPQIFPRLPSQAGEGELQPMIWPRIDQHPGVASPFARERIAPTIFNSVESLGPIGGEITLGGQVARPLRGLLPERASRAARKLPKK